MSNSGNNEKRSVHEEEVKVLNDGLPGDLSIKRCRKKRFTLKRTLGMPGVFSIAYGNLGSSIYFALGLIAVYALGATPLVFLIAAIFFLFTALAYAEGTAAIPEAGGSSSFARKGFNETVSFISAWCLLLGYIAATGIASMTAIDYLSTLEAFKILHNPPWNFTAIGGLLFFLMTINIIGVRKSSVLNVLFAGVDVLTQVFIFILGAMFFLNLPALLKQIHWGIAPDWTYFATAIYIVMISFTGIETLSNLAEESKTPETTIPKATWMSVGIIVILFLGLSVVGLGAMPVSYQIEGYAYGIPADMSGEFSAQANEAILKINYYKSDEEKLGKPVENACVSVGKNSAFTDKDGYFKISGIGYGPAVLQISKPGTRFNSISFDSSNSEAGSVTGKWSTDLSDKWRSNPLLGIVSKLPVFRKPLEVWVSILAFTIMVIATNAGILGVSRLVFSMGSYRQIPPFLAHVHPKFRTPYIAIIIFTFITFLIVLPGNIVNVAHVYSFAAMISYTIAHVSIIALRVRHPEMARPYKIPLNIRIQGKEIPITSIIGALGCFGIWIAVSITKEYGRNVGIPFILAGLVIYFLYRKSQGLSLTETVDPKRRR